MLSPGTIFRLENLEKLAWMEAKIRYRNRFVDRIDCPRLNYLWNKQEQQGITQKETTELFSILFSRMVPRRQRARKK